MNCLKKMKEDIPWYAELCHLLFPSEEKAVQTWVLI